MKLRKEIWTENNNIRVVDMEMVIEAFGINGIAIEEYVRENQTNVKKRI